jgi:hypothetical protein
MRSGTIIIAALLLAACQPAPAPPPPADPVQTASAAAHQAADQLVTMGQASETTGQPPRQADPAAGPLLDKVFNTAPLQGAPAPYGDMDAVHDWLLSTERVGQIYLLVGTGQTDLSVAGANPALQARIEQNGVVFAPEYGRYIDAELATEAAEAATLVPYLAANQPSATVAQAADKARAAFTQTAQSVLIQAAVLPGFTSDWREARARALVAFAPRVNPFVTDAQKQALGAAALQAAGSSTDPQLAVLLNQFAAAIVAKPAS